MDKLLLKLKEFAYSEVERTGMPIKMHVDLATAKGIELAKKFNADLEIVEAGTLMMDCILGDAIQEGRVKDHVEMCYAKTKEILAEFNDISKEDKENILQCVKQHHGSDKFYSIESEICCNADCYRFISIKGFTISVRYLRDMPFEEMVKLVTNKVDEKWNALTLDLCKKEIEPQYKTILKFLDELKTN